ncbi:MAG: pyridoxamine 5'-phosphate oxidase family protein [Acidothermales bacterium]|nr:pyridoxamine 5'-phosphate oxidase family protein [Acidothermales bacterium]
MATWDEVRASAPDLARAAEALFDAHRHKMLATLRRDGSPRLSGIESFFTDGDLWLGMMHGSRKAHDLQRDPRLALHSPSVDPPDDPTAWAGDAKVSGRAEEIADAAEIQRVLVAAGQDEAAAAGPLHLFRVDISDVTTVRVGDPADHLVIELWREGEGLRRMRRE